MEGTLRKCFLMLYRYQKNSSFCLPWTPATLTQRKSKINIPCGLFTKIRGFDRTPRIPSGYPPDTLLRLVWKPASRFTERDSQTAAPIVAAGTGLDYVSHHSKTFPGFLGKGSAMPNYVYSNTKWASAAH